MTARQLVTLESAASTVKALAVLIGALMTSLGALGSVAWWALTPYIAPVLALPQQVEQLSQTVEMLTKQLPRTASVEFQPLAVAIPPTARAGDDIRITYTLRRNRTCPATVTQSWHSMTLGAVDTRHTTTAEVTRAPVTSDYRPWSRIITVPDLAPGVWAFAPEIIPAGECAGEPPIYPPLAIFEVVE